MDSRFQELRQQGWEIYQEGGPYVDMIGPLWVRGDIGQREYGLIIDRRHMNCNGVVHGGMLVSIIDQVISLVIRENVQDVPMATASLNTHFIDAVHDGDFLMASGVVQRRTRSLVFAHGELHVGDRLCLSAEAIMKLRSGPMT